MRSFIALPVTADARRTLEETQAALRRKGVRGRFTPPENHHLTLAFLGNVEDPAPVIAAMRRVPVPKTALRFDRLTLFGDVLVALFRPNDALERYARALRDSLDEAGIKYDRQAFRPHITLCRKTALPCPDFRLSPSERELRGLRLPVKEVRLMSSDLSGETPQYTAVYTQR
ncbi:MAG: RNA 2',3'-cyclic phosphodiesterase [Clostridia bacterium]|nr:RNA 2',3'-cyclic phosphodiesterase [Clostridia bacterium]